MSETRDYLVIAPDRPTPEEYRRGAQLIPSMLDEGALVWRVPGEHQEELFTLDSRVCAGSIDGNDALRSSSGESKGRYLAGAPLSGAMDVRKCSRGWAARCARSRGRRCRCACGGANHGATKNLVNRDPEPVP